MSGFSINRAIHSGNLTRDPELRSLQSGTSVCSLRIAVNERFKDGNGEWQDRPNYFTWTVWAGMGEWCARELRKGDGITLEGRCRWREWQGDDGSKREAVEFTADSIVPQRRGEGGGNGRQQLQNEQANYGGGFQPHAQSDVPGAQQGEFEHAPAGNDGEDYPF